MRLGILAHSRTGDKGDTSNISVVAYDPADYPHLERHVTAELVRAHFAGIVAGEVVRYALPKLGRAELRAPPRLGRRGHAIAGAGRPWQVSQLADPRPRDPRPRMRARTARPVGAGLADGAPAVRSSRACGGPGTSWSLGGNGASVRTRRGPRLSPPVRTGRGVTRPGPRGLRGIRNAIDFTAKSLLQDPAPSPHGRVRRKGTESTLGTGGRVARFGRSDRRAQGDRPTLRSIRPKRARRPSDASVDPTEARKATVRRFGRSHRSANEIVSRDATSGAIGSSVQPIMRNSSRNSSMHESRGAKLARIIVIGASSRAYDAVAPANHVVGAIPSHACSLVLRGEPSRAPGRGRAASDGARAGAPGRVGPDGRSHPHPLCDRARRRAGSRAAPAAGLRRAAPVGQPETGPGKAWSELQATGLVHEGYLRLLDGKAVQR